eukprot:6708298-Prymnesium_polylepis.1
MAPQTDEGADADDGSPGSAPGVFWPTLPLAPRKPHALHSVMPQRHLGVADVPHAVHVRPDSSGGAGAIERGLRAQRERERHTHRHTMAL